MTRTVVGSAEATLTGDGIGRRWAWAGGICGILAAVAFAVGEAGADSTLTSSASVQQLTRYFVDHRGGVLAQTVCTIVGAALLLWLFLTLAAVIGERDRRSPLGWAVLAGGTASVVIMALDGVSLTALAFLVRQGGLSDPALTRAFYDLENGILMPGVFGITVCVLWVAIGIAAIRRVFMAPWVGWLSLLVALLSAIGGVVGLTSVDGGTSVFGFAPLLGLVVVLIASVYLLRYQPDVSRRDDRART